MTERPSKEENDKVVSVSDAILKTMSSDPSCSSFQICLSALADAMIYVCQNLKFQKIEFKDICQQIVNQYEEIFVDEEV